MVNSDVGATPFELLQLVIAGVKFAEWTSPPEWKKDLPITCPWMLDWFTDLVISANGAKMVPSIVELPFIFKVFVL